MSDESLTDEAQIEQEMFHGLEQVLRASRRAHLDHTGATCLQDYGQGPLAKRRDDCCCICATANLVMDAMKEINS